MRAAFGASRKISTTGDESAKSEKGRHKAGDGRPRAFSSSPDDRMGHVPGDDEDFTPSMTPRSSRSGTPSHPHPDRGGPRPELRPRPCPNRPWRRAGGGGGYGFGYLGRGSWGITGPTPRCTRWACTRAPAWCPVPIFLNSPAKTKPSPPLVHGASAQVLTDVLTGHGVGRAPVTGSSSRSSRVPPKAYGITQGAVIVGIGDRPIRTLDELHRVSHGPERGEAHRH